MQKKIVIPFFLFLAFLPVLFAAEIQFTDYTLTSSGTLLFTAEATCPGFGTYQTLFLTNIKSKQSSQLTFFPEKISFLSATGVLQVQNRFGVFRSDQNLGNFSVLSAFPSFIGGNEIQAGKLTPVETSPDGKYLVYFKATSEVFGNLILADSTTGAETIVSENAPLCLHSDQVSWSPDSRTFVYAKGGQLYFFSIGHLENNRVLAETYRNFAQGSLANVQWDAMSSLYFIHESLVYRIDTTELFARALYSGTLQIGSIVGKLPFQFSSSLDRFWLSPDGKKILLNKSQQSLFFFYLTSKDYAATQTIPSLPHLFLPRSMRVAQVLWSSGNAITILTKGIEQGKDISRIFRLSVAADGSVQGFSQMPEQGIIRLALSADERTVLLLGGERIDLYGNSTWKKEGEIAYTGALHALWKSKSEIIIAGTNTIELYDTTKKTTTVLALSQPGESGFSMDGNSILTKNNGKIYVTASSAVDWKTTAAFTVKAAQVSNAEYRIYTETIESAGYKNMLMARDLNGLTTNPLFAYTKFSPEEFPATEDPIDLTFFNHGSRIRRREVAIVFNAVHSTEGLSTVLDALKDYDIKCTFFVNGEFIRRFPDAVKEIADSGHEVGSLFYAYFDMTDARYTVDTDFIKKGLARNEDEYFQASGKELSLLWHAPYYFTSSSIIAASKEMNYSYVGRDVDSLDWAGKDDQITGGTNYLAAPRLVERILNLKKPGSIIPIELGVSSETRDDYLFQYLDELLNALSKLGYEVVTVSQLIEHAK